LNDLSRGDVCGVSKGKIHFPLKLKVCLRLELRLRDFAFLLQFPNEQSYQFELRAFYLRFDASCASLRNFASNLGLWDCYVLSDSQDQYYLCSNSMLIPETVDVWGLHF